MPDIGILGIGLVRLSSTTYMSYQVTCIHHLQQHAVYDRQSEWAREKGCVMSHVRKEHSIGRAS